MLVGSRIHSLRLRRGLTLETLSEKVGVHKGHLSRIERGEKTPSVGTLTAIAAALEVEMAELFGEKSQKEDVVLVRKAERPVLAGDSPHYRIESILPGSSDRHFSIYHITPGPEFLEEDVSSHSGQKGVYCLSGTVEVSIAERLIELKAGDCVAFEANLKHFVRRKGRQGSTALVIVS